MTSDCLELLGKWVEYLSLRVDGSRSFDEFSGLYIAPYLCMVIHRARIEIYIERANMT